MKEAAPLITELTVHGDWAGFVKQLPLLGAMKEGALRFIPVI